MADWGLLVVYRWAQAVTRRSSAIRLNLSILSQGWNQAYARLRSLELDITPGTPDNPASIRVALLRYTRGEDGRLFITLDCVSLEELEGQINSLQDELDEIRERAQRAFQVT